MKWRSLSLLLPLLFAAQMFAASHPLEPLSADEHRAAYESVRAHFAAATPLPDEALLFPFIALREPAKAFVRSWPGGDFPRVPYSASDYAPLLRAAFARHAFWLTRFRDDERYAAGDFPNQGPAGAGRQAFTTPPEPLDPETGTDVVAWQTIGLSHAPRPEDYPVMPTETIGFKLVPHGFFDRNPALDAQELPQGKRRQRAVRPR